MSAIALPPSQRDFQIHRLHLVTRAAQHVGAQRADPAFVVDNEDRAHVAWVSRPPNRALRSSRDSVGEMLYRGCVLFCALHNALRPGKAHSEGGLEMSRMTGRV